MQNSFQFDEFIYIFLSCSWNPFSWWFPPELAFKIQKFFTHQIDFRLHFDDWISHCSFRIWSDFSTFWYFMVDSGSVYELCVPNYPMVRIDPTLALCPFTWMDPRKTGNSWNFVYNQALILTIFFFSEFNRIIDTSFDLDECWIIDLQILCYQVVGLRFVGVAFETFGGNVFGFLRDSLGRRSLSFGFCGWIHRNVLSCKWHFFLILLVKLKGIMTQ